MQKVNAFALHSWRIDIDKAHYLLYKQEKDPDFAALCSRALHRNKKSTTDTQYAFIVLQPDGRCGFQDTDGGCRIYRKLGPKALSQTCTLYPRQKVVFPDHWELSLSLSCEEAVRLAVLTLEPLHLNHIEFTLTTTDPLRRAGAKDGSSIQQLSYGQALRSAVLELIQYRDCTLAERIIAIVLLLRRLDKLEVANSEASFHHEIESFLKSIKNGDFKGFFDTLDYVRDAHISIIGLPVISLLENRKGPVSQRLMEMLTPYLERGDSGNIRVGERALEFLLEELSRKSDPFVQRHSEWIENYFANYIFSSLFPFCYREKGTSLEQNGMLLIQLYAMLRIALLLPKPEDDTDEKKMITAAVHVARIAQHAHLEEDFLKLTQTLMIHGTAKVTYLLR